MQKDLDYLNRHNFRVLCNALAMPGSTHALQKAFDSYILACASVLLYAEVSYINLTKEDFWVLHSLCNAKNENTHNADYIFTDSLDSTLLENVKKGSFKDPEFSASVIYCYDSNAPLYPYKLQGAGVNGSIEQSYPLSNELVKDFLTHNTHFPMGFEIYFLHTQTGEVKALSRTTILEAL